MFKWTKRLVLLGVVGGAIVAVCVVTGASSYVMSSGRMIGSKLKDSIPIEFEIQRARDLLDDLVPELRANVRLVAAEDVAVETLERDIGAERERVEKERSKVRTLRDALKQQHASYRFGSVTYDRDEVVGELERRFDNLRTAEKMLASREDLLKNRRRSLQAAINKLEKTRIARVELAAEIEALEAQFRLMQAQTDDSQFTLDDSKLAQTHKVIGELKNRLQVAQKVMAREAKLVEFIPVEVKVSETTVVERIDTYFDRSDAEDTPAVAATGTGF